MNDPALNVGGLLVFVIGCLLAAIGPIKNCKKRNAVVKFYHFVVASSILLILLLHFKSCLVETTQDKTS